MPRPHANFFKYHRHRAKAGNRRLQEIGADKSREKEPVWAMDLGQCDTYQNKTSGNGIDYTIDIHCDLLIIRPGHIGERGSVNFNGF